jgi:hypothetical protein
MPTPTIPAGNLFMNATTYTGNGATQTITNGAAGAAFQPDLVWVKSRSSATYNELYDSVRGVSKRLFSNDTAAEADFSPYGVTAFNSNGFTVNDVTSSGYGVNESGVSYIGWNWKAGGTAVTNTSGTISSQVSANTTAGFSVVTCTSPASAGSFTFGHGLGVAPKFIISKSRSGTGNWSNYHASTGAGGYLLFTTAAYTANTDTWNNTTPTSTLISSTTNWWGTSSNLVFYCWSEIAGFSSFGSYTGNGSTDGPFVYCGFRPKFIMFKIASGGTGNWEILDTSRNTYNTADLLLLPSSSAAESSAYGSYYVDFVSNGFKIRGSGAGFNGSGEGMIYAAFAENPFKYANAR